jgi:predicted ATPase
LISLLTARLARLSLQEQHVIQLAAIVGIVFWSELVQALIGDDTPVEDVLAALQRARLIRERRYLSDLGKEYVFLSALIRDAAYESLINSQRVRYHLLTAEFLESLIHESVLPQYHGLIAYHYRQANVCQKELFHTLLAAENAQKVYANTEAIRQYALALKLLDELNDCSDSLAQNLIDAWRLWSDSVAERIVILGALPKGRAQDIVNEGIGEEIPVAWLDGAEAISYLADRVELAAKRARDHQRAIEDLDVISDGLLQTIVEGLEEQLWMLRAHLR